MAFEVPRTDVLIKILGAPYRTELVTSALRLAQALLDEGASVQVWACGEATGLTRVGLGEVKPANVLDRRREYPSTARIVRELVAGAQRRLDWYACRFCCEDRGAADQIPEVRKRPPSAFWDHVRAAGTTLALGA